MWVSVCCLLPLWYDILSSWPIYSTLISSTHHTTHKVMFTLHHPWFKLSCMDAAWHFCPQGQPIKHRA